MYFRAQKMILVTMMALTVQQCVTVPKILNDTDTFFSGTKCFRYRYRYFFRYQIFPIPVPRLFSGTKFFRYRFRYFFPVPIFSDTGSDTTKKMKNSRYREFPVPVRHTLASSMEDDMEISPKKVFGAVLMYTGGI